MKFAIACLLATTSAIKVTSSACLSATPQFGILCALDTADLEENNLFSTGMDGEEDLEEDITINGSPYRFLQGRKRSVRQ